MTDERYTALLERLIRMERKIDEILALRNPASGSASASIGHPQCRYPEQHYGGGGTYVGGRGGGGGSREHPNKGTGGSK